MPLVGFSPRKTAISLYVFTGKDAHEYLFGETREIQKRKILYLYQYAL